MQGFLLVTGDVLLPVSSPSGPQDSGDGGDTGYGAPVTHSLFQEPVTDLPAEDPRVILLVLKTNKILLLKALSLSLTNFHP